MKNYLIVGVIVFVVVLLAISGGKGEAQIIPTLVYYCVTPTTTGLSSIQATSTPPPLPTGTATPPPVPAPVVCSNQSYLPIVNNNVVGSSAYP